MLCLVVLIGCGNDSNQENDSGNNFGYGFHFDVQGSTGLKVRWENTSGLGLSTLEDIYIGIMSCAGATVTGPLLIFQPDIQERFGHVGVYFYNTNTVAIDSDQPLNSTGQEVLRHEYTHHVLKLSGADFNQNENHGHVAFTNCSSLQHL